MINGLTDTAHPCQALGDLLSMQEVSDGINGKTLAFVGDGNNVAQSLVHACAMVGMKFRLLGPSTYFIKDSFLQEVAKQYPNLDFVQSDKPEKILPGADFVYTDVWISMGQEAEAAERIRAFSPFQLSEKLMALTGMKSKIMHCLPARRGEEITDGVIDSAESIIVQQAGNRMHAQKALLLWMSLQHGTLDPALLTQEGIKL